MEIQTSYYILSEYFSPANHFLGGRGLASALKFDSNFLFGFVYWVYVFVCDP